MTRPLHLLAFAFVVFCIPFTGCTSGTVNQLASNELSKGSHAARITVSSPAFRAGGAIPAKYAADNGNVSPPLQWSGAPGTVVEYVLIVEDPDAPMPRPFVHWIAFRIPPGATALPEDAGNTALVSQGNNGTGNTGYFGPKPPPGKPHRYFFQLFALDAPLGAKDGATRDEVVKAMNGKVVGAGNLVGTYQTTK
jgi:Raf kinase inhibitor-like YbhB/YbcL family protein